MANLTHEAYQAILSASNAFETRLFDFACQAADSKGVGPITENDVTFALGKFLGNNHGLSEPLRNTKGASDEARRAG